MFLSDMGILSRVSLVLFFVEGHKCLHKTPRIVFCQYICVLQDKPSCTDVSIHRTRQKLELLPHLAGSHHLLPVNSNRN